MKRRFAWLLVLVFFLFAIPAYAEVFIRIDRDDPEAWANELDNVRFLTEEGMSGSAQFSADQFHILAGQLRERAQKTVPESVKLIIQKGSNALCRNASLAFASFTQWVN